MYIAMNRFKINRGQEEAFEHVWKTRETHLDSVPGFNNFHLLKADSNEVYTLYASQYLEQPRRLYQLDKI